MQKKKCPGATPGAPSPSLVDPGCCSGRAQPSPGAVPPALWWGEVWWDTVSGSGQVHINPFSLFTFTNRTKEIEFLFLGCLYFWEHGFSLHASLGRMGTSYSGLKAIRLFGVTGVPLLQGPQLAASCLSCSVTLWVRTCHLRADTTGRS